jgi:hypothetical protein
MSDGGTHNDGGPEKAGKQERTTFNTSSPTVLHASPAVFVSHDRNVFISQPAAEFMTTEPASASTRRVSRDSVDSKDGFTKDSVYSSETGIKGFRKRGSIKRIVVPSDPETAVQTDSPNARANDGIHRTDDTFFTPQETETSPSSPAPHNGGSSRKAPAPAVISTTTVTSSSQRSPSEQTRRSNSILQATDDKVFPEPSTSLRSSESQKSAVERLTVDGLNEGFSLQSPTGIISEAAIRTNTDMQQNSSDDNDTGIGPGRIREYGHEGEADFK